MTATQRLGLYFHVHLVSDSTGETLTHLLKAGAAQFEGVIPIEHLYALMRGQRQLERVLQSIEDSPGIVLYTIVNEDLRLQLERRCAELEIPCVAVLDPLLATLSRYLRAPLMMKAGAQHLMNEEYSQRIEAINYAMAHDDGQNAADLEKADVVLVGVSRTSKTPTCMYLAHRGVKAGNLPLVSASDAEMVEHLTRPLVVGLTASPDRLVQIRRSRLLGLKESRDTSYVDETAVRDEVLFAKRLFERKGWPVIDVSRRSIEETAAKIINLLGERGQAGAA